MFLRIFTGLVLAGMAVTIGYGIFDRLPPIVVQSVEVITPSVAPGGELKIRYSVRRDRACVTRVQKMLSDATGKTEIYDETEILAVLRPPGADVYISSTIIPKNFERGMARYRSARRYECNPTHKVWPIAVLIADLTFMVEGEAMESPIEVVPRR